MERMQKKEEQKRATGQVMSPVQLAKVMGNQATIAQRTSVIQRIKITESKYSENYIRTKISTMDLPNIGTSSNCSGFVDTVVTLAFDNNYYPWNSLKVDKATKGYSSASDYDILLFYSPKEKVNKHISFKVGDNSVGRNQGDPSTYEVMFIKPIVNFEREGFVVYSISAYKLIEICGRKNETERATDPEAGCCCVVQ